VPEFDFIVVGSGPGGAVVANRLAVEFPNKTVVIIEAGQEAPVNVVPPANFPFGLKNEATRAYHANASPRYGNAFIQGIKCDVGKDLFKQNILKII
jgi:choline dehydrogenase